FGSVVSGRNGLGTDFTNTVGLFINTLPKRIKFNKGDKFENLCRKTQRDDFQSQQYNFLSLDQIKRETGLPHDPIDHILIIQNTPFKQQDSSNAFTFKNVITDHNTNYDLSASVLISDQLKFVFAYYQDSFRPGQIELLVNCFKNMFDQLISNEKVGIEQLKLLSLKEERAMIKRGTGTKVEMPGKSLSDLISQSYNTFKDRNAIEFKGRYMSYQQLEKKVNMLSGLLFDEYKIIKGHHVGIYLKKSEDMIVAVLALLKLGAVIVPIDSKYPIKRVEKMLKISDCKLLVTSQDLKQLSNFSLSRCYIDAATKKQDNTEIMVKTTSEDPAYIIFTSGSSGEPKGVEVSNKSIVNYLTWANEHYFNNEIGNDFAFFTSISFDLTLTSIFTTLLRGDSIVISTEELDLPDIIRDIFDNTTEVNTVKMTPSHVNVLRDINLNSTNVKTVILGGEELKASQVATLKQLNPEMRIFNEYGPTEATVGCSYKEVSKGGSINIGSPIFNTSLYVLDSSMHFQPIWGKGELYIAGDCLSNGYFNNQSKTNESFLEFQYDTDAFLVYKTGDIVSWTNENELLLHGRRDNQVKLNGHRIELKEIEFQLNEIPEIDEAVVITQKVRSDLQIVSYYTVKNSRISEEQIISFLSDRLPNFMIPAAFNCVASFPLTANGKIDISQLTLNKRDKVIVLPKNEVESQVRDIWADVLKISQEDISTDEDFFKLEANSLIAIKLLIKVNDLISKEIKLTDLYDNRTIQQQAKIFKPYMTELAVSEGLKKSEKKEYYQLSNSQKRLFVLNQLDRESLSYNISAGFDVLGDIDIQRLEETFRELSLKHEILRTKFFTHNGHPVQLVLNNQPIKVEYFESADAETHGILEKFFRPFDLGNPPLIRVGLIKMDTSSYKLIIDMHHIVCDGISVDLFVRDFIKAYDGEDIGKGNLQYIDYAVWQNSYLTSNAYSTAKEYWNEKFKNYSPQLGLPIDFKRQLVRSTNGLLKTYQLSKNLTAKIRGMAEQLDVSLYTLLLSSVGLLLGKLGNSEEVVLATSASGRDQSGLENIMGMFVNTLPMRCVINRNNDFKSLAVDMQRMVIESLEHQQYSFENLVSDLELEFDASRNPIFDVMFVLQEDWERAFEIPDMVLKPIKIDKKVAKFDLTIECVAKEERLEFNMEYNTDIFYEETIDRYFEYLLNIIEDACNNPNKRCADIQILSKQNLDQILFEFNDTKKAYSDDTTLHELIEQQVERAPDRVAVIAAGEKITYRELNREANRIAHSLINAGLNKGELVGIFLSRRIEMVACVLGVLKAGGAYVPLEPNHPNSRLSKIVRSLEMSYIITESDKISRVKVMIESSSPISNILCVDIDSAEDIESLEEDIVRLVGKDELTSLSSENPRLISSANDLAYVIHTSGSSGLPKGVLVRHKPAVNLIEWVNNTYDIDEKHKLLFVTSLGFDLSVYDIFGILIAGGIIRLASEQEIQDSEQILNILFEEEITFWDSAPAAIQQVLPHLAKQTFNGKKGILKRVFLSGDWVPLSIKEDLESHFDHVEVTALGGATEATIWSNYFEVDKIDPNWSSIPYGKPIQNAKYYVLDQDLNCSPIGTPGDLYIGGECLADGYINEVELTNSKFIKNPFCQNEIIYRTGDRARWFADGNLEFLGRLDSQVKLRGYRIELREIETQLKQHNRIGDVVVDIRTLKGEKERKICAYYTASSEIDSRELNNFLSNELPYYMVPSYFVRIDSIPVTVNGKMDKKSLPEPDLNRTAIKSIPKTPLEQMVVDICGRILKVAPEIISLDASFAQQGGNSIDAINLVTEIENRISIKINLIEIFRLSSLQDLCKEIEGYQVINDHEISGGELDELII
ncbi:amino acid adenylation domain-containing protein, partial [Fulvivirga kasyanovii]|nr:amino acid adenylation domain-containing protein [Fulvivirga kasyanovii]